MPRRTRRCGGMSVMSLPSKTIAAGGRLDAAADQADEGGLAGAVRADDGADLARHDGEVDVVDGLQAAEVAAEPARGEQRRHGSHLAQRSRIVPSMPFGKKSTSRISATPTISM